MKVVLIAVPIMDWEQGTLVSIAMDARRECPPYGVYLLATVLREAGHECLVIALVADASSEIDRYREPLASAGLVGISSTSMGWPTARVVLDKIRELRPDVPIVAGGIHPTLFDTYVLDRSPCDYVVRGEGEVSLASLCAALEGRRDFAAIPNLSWRGPDGRFVRNPAGPKIPKEELATFPVADYSELQEGVYKALAIESSRGCSYDCSFCSTSYRKTWRPMGAEEFVDRLEVVLRHSQRTQCPYVYVVDDEFAMNPRRVVEISKVFERRDLRPRLVFDARAPDVYFEDFLPRIKDYTLAFLVGSECGYDEGLARIGKGTTTAMLERAAKELHEHGMAAQADFSFMLGLPWESVADVRKTIRFAGHLHAAYGVTVLLQWYYQIPGSRLWDDARREGAVHEAMYDEFGFFTRNLYLFRTANRLRAEEIWEVTHEVAEMVSIARMGSLSKRDVGLPAPKRIEYRHPGVVDHYFPEAHLDPEGLGLSNLRELARPKGNAGSPLPLRSMSGAAGLAAHH